MSYSIENRRKREARVKPGAELLQLSAAAVEVERHPRTLVRWSRDPRVGLELIDIRGRKYVARQHWERVKAGLTGQRAVAAE
jgi:hypothetical protein